MLLWREGITQGGCPEEVMFDFLVRKSFRISWWRLLEDMTPHDQKMAVVFRLVGDYCPQVVRKGEGVCNELWGGLFARRDLDVDKAW